MMRYNLLPAHFKYTTLLYWIFMHLSVPTCITTKGQAQGTKCLGWTIPSSWAPGSSSAIPRGRDMPHDWQQGCAGTGLPRNSNPCYQKAEASRASWGQICHVAPFQLQAQRCPHLQCKVRNSRKPLLLQIPVCPSPSPVLHRAPSSTQIWVCSLQLSGYLPTSQTIHHKALLPFKSIHMLKILEKTCCLNELTPSKVPGIHFHFHLWTFYSAPNIETYSTKSIHASLLSHTSLLRGLCSSPNDRDSSAVTGCSTRHLWKSNFGNRKYSL